MPVPLQEFPTHFADLETDHLLAVFKAGPDRFDQVLEGLSEGELGSRPRPGKWSAREIVAHVTDSELMGAARIRQTIAQASRQYALYDQDVWCDRLSYQERDGAHLAECRLLFRLLRSTTARLFEGCDANDWVASGVHREYGEVTTRQLLELYADHSERHLEQLLTIRRLLGREIELPELLPERLY